MHQSVLDANDRMQANVEAYYEQRGGDSGQWEEDTRFVEAQMDQLETENVRTVLISLGMFSIALVIMLSNHAYMNRRNREHEIIANVDPLTGVKSKHAYLLKEKEIDAAIKAGDTPEFGIVVGDVNGLKHINDTQGHKAGDEYIRKASQLICEIFRHSPVYRIGGDEFVMILTGRDYENRNELLKELHECSVRNIGTGNVVVSGGLSVCDPERDESFHMVFERADQQMYEEKQLLKGLGSITRDEAPQKAGALPGTNQGTEPLQVRRKVLVVEDVEINRLMLGAVLEDNYDILYAEDGDEAMKVVRENKDVISTILLDLQMPRMGGREVLLSLNGDPELRRIPVIILTGDQDAEVECLRLGAMDFIPKPYPDAEIIRARVDKCTELYESRSTILSTERDQLTGLYNVDYFDRYVSMFDRHYADLIMDAVAIDINHFHMINERYGKEYGDTILQRLGARIREAAREMGGVGCHRGRTASCFIVPHRKTMPRCWSG